MAAAEAVVTARVRQSSVDERREQREREEPHTHREEGVHFDDALVPAAVAERVAERPDERPRHVADEAYEAAAGAGAKGDQREAQAEQGLDHDEERQEYRV